ncbi:uncharacterized protein LOC133832283 [Humulus lupulus]|uniref:uncharacterized protein LOC133832283 n=1 Tax=Humulus lupulus TaxID=3486 RepID=UPI002B4026EE|nr:uncharacterized protein LOC133832283 [Humulus lupulus]
MVDEFVTLIKGGLSIIEYTQKFDRLARFALEIVQTEAIQIQRFVKGIKPVIARDLRMNNAEVVSYAEILDKALDVEYLEDRIWKDSAARRTANKNNGFHENNKRKAHEGQSNGNDKRPSPLAPNDINHNNRNHHNNHNNHNNGHNRRTH